MMIVVMILHVIMCLILIAIVLFQTGKGASMGAAFGGGSNTLFGAAGPASFLNKLTTVAAVVFMVTSFTLAILSSRATDASRVLDAPIEQTETAPEAGTTAEEPPAQPTVEVTTEAPAEEATVEPAAAATTEAPVVEAIAEPTTATEPAAQPATEATPVSATPGNQ